MKTERKNSDLQTSTSSSSTIDSSDNESSFIEKTKPSLSAQIITIINLVLEKNRKSHIKNLPGCIFNSHRVPSISIETYFNRIINLSLKKNCNNDSIVVSALIFIDRLCKSKDNIILSHNNIHKIVLIAIMLSIKYNNDQHYSNQSYAKIGGIPLNELNMMEHEFLSIIGYELYISDDLYEKYERYLLNLPMSE